VSTASANPTGQEPSGPTLDATSPWLGLASFTEDTRAYFYGREEEVAELARRVQRKLLTVMFGQSGLGKTSILRAGLVPRLRGQGYCPVYVRIDYRRDAPEPAAQIKAAIAATARHSGEWTQAGVAVAGESLWEFLHHRDDVLRDEHGQTLIPLLIFDQFEEIFTLAQTDDFGRARASRFIADLSDLVENRPPKTLEARLEHDDAAAECFDFARSDYRVLIALREDYLAPLEGLKSSMPSITQNRLRLAPMTGTQALEAVRRPGGRLVSEDVAEAIVRFVAGGAEIANAEVEPSLLSLICRELNDKRLAEGRPEISLDLLAGSHATILAQFYERSLADQPDAVRRVIEDELLTESGFRENIAEERIVSLFNGAGAAPGTLALLVDRRLLRIEERLDVRRAELTHDVLCAVVKSSRDLRHEREARDRTERLLTEQRERELAARTGLVRARKVAAACAVLAVAALAALVVAFISAQQARRAQREAQDTRVAAEVARSQAEHLLGYLNEDFEVELAGFGRLTLVKELAEKEVEYYRSLPESLRTADTRRSAAIAEIRYGVVLQKAYDLDESDRTLTAAVAALEKMRADGDRSEGTAIGLALGLSAMADVANRKTGATATAEVDDYNRRAVETLAPFGEAPGASASSRRAFATVAISAASYANGDAAFELFDRGKKALESLGALSLTDLNAAADYTNALVYQSIELFRLDRVAELQRATDQGRLLADEVLAQRPGHLVALEARMVLEGLAAVPLERALRIREALTLLDRSFADAQGLLRLDPTNIDSRNRARFSRTTAAANWLRLGQPRRALAAYQQAIEMMQGAGRESDTNGDIYAEVASGYATVLQDVGDSAGAKASLAEAAAMLDAVAKKSGAGSGRVVEARCGYDRARGRIALLQGNFTAAREITKSTLDAVGKLAWGHGYGVSAYLCKSRVAGTLAEAAVDLGDYAAAEAAITAVGAAPPGAKSEDVEAVRIRLILWHAIALARSGRAREAASVIAPIVEFERERYARNHEDELQRLSYAQALYAQALATPGNHDALLAQATRIVAALPREMQQLSSVRSWRERIAAESRTPSATVRARAEGAVG